MQSLEELEELKKMTLNLFEKMHQNHITSLNLFSSFNIVLFCAVGGGCADRNVNFVVVPHIFLRFLVLSITKAADEDHDDN